MKMYDCNDYEIRKYWTGGAYTFLEIAGEDGKQQAKCLDHSTNKFVFYNPTGFKNIKPNESFTKTKELKEFTGEDGVKFERNIRTISVIEKDQIKVILENENKAKEDKRLSRKKEIEDKVAKGWYTRKIQEGDPHGNWHISTEILSDKIEDFWEVTFEYFEKNFPHVVYSQSSSIGSTCVEKFKKRYETQHIGKFLDKAEAGDKLAWIHAYRDMLAQSGGFGLIKEDGTQLYLNHFVS